MAVNVNKTSSLLFTLPVSCQICLGKVKQPVICPNQHVFCADCMEVWLQRNKQCPTCRIEITRENPCRPVLGGLSEVESDNDFASRDMRRARMEMLFKDYETEINRLLRQNELLNEEIVLLNEKLSGVSDHHDAVNQTVNSETAARVTLLNQKLEDTKQLYDLAKRESKKLKEENRKLEEENGRLTIENKNLRIEMEHRSPRKYGRTAMAAMESRMGDYLKEISGLQKALERSDSYIKDLEEQLESKKANAPPNERSSASSSAVKAAGSTGGAYQTSVSKTATVRGREATKGGKTAAAFNFDDSESFLNDTDAPDDVATASRRDAARRTDDKNGGDDDDTFQLELPSPTGPKTKSRSGMDELEDATMDDSSAQMDGRSTGAAADDTLETPSPVANIKKRLRFSETVPPASAAASTSGAAGGGLADSLSTVLPHTQKALLSIGALGGGLSSSQGQIGGIDFMAGAGHDTGIQPGFSLASSSRSISSGVASSGSGVQVGGARLDSLRTPGGKSSLNTSITPEMEDCMKLFEEAERKVEGRRVVDTDITIPMQVANHQRMPSSFDRFSSPSSQGNFVASSTTLTSQPHFARSLPVPQSPHLIGASNLHARSQQGLYPSTQHPGHMTNGLAMASTLAFTPASGLNTVRTSQVYTPGLLTSGHPTSSGGLFGESLLSNRNTLSQSNLLASGSNSLSSTLRSTSYANVEHMANSLRGSSNNLRF